MAPRRVEAERAQAQVDHGGASGAPLRSGDEGAHARLNAEPSNSEKLYTDKESEVEQTQTQVKASQGQADTAAQSTMESHSDTVDANLHPYPSSWADTPPCHGFGGIEEGGSNTKVGEIG